MTVTKVVVADVTRPTIVPDLSVHTFGDGAPAVIYRDGHPSGDDRHDKPWWWRCQLDSIGPDHGAASNLEVALSALATHQHTRHRCAHCHGTGRVRHWYDKQVLPTLECDACCGTGVWLK